MTVLPSFRPPARLRLLTLLLPASLLVPAGLSATSGTGAPTPSTGDSIRVVEPGGVATVPVRFPASGDEAVSYHIVPRSDVRLLGDTTGRARASDGHHVVPLTVLVPESQPAGKWTLASVVLEPSGADRRRRRVRVRVAERRGLRVAVDRSAAKASPGTMMRVRFTVTNTGNVSDTVRLTAASDARRWRFLSPNDPRPLGPGAEWRDTARIRVPERIEEGVARRMVVRAETSGGAAAEADVLLRSTAEGSGFLPGMEELPASLFLSTSRIRLGGGGETPSVVGSLDASGPVGNGLELDLFARHRPNLDPPGGVRTFLTGPAARAELSADTWEVAAGDVYGDRSPIAGTPVTGRGLRGGWSTSGWGGGLFLTKPPGRSRLLRDGQRLFGYLDRQTSYGSVGVTASWMKERPFPGGSALGRRSVGVGYETETVSGLDHLRVRGGWMQLTRGDTLAGQGPSAEAEFRLGGEQIEGWGRLRRVPGLLPIVGNRGNEIRLGGRLAAGSDVDLLGTIYHSDAPLLLSGRDQTRRGVRAGGDVTAGDGDVRLTAGLEQERTRLGELWRDQLELDLDVHLPTGPVGWTGRVDVEKRLSFGERAGGWHLQFLTSGIRYAREDFRTRFSVHALDLLRETGRPGTPWRFTLRGRWSGEHLGVKWRAHTLGSIARPDEHLDGWGRLRYDLDDRSALVTTIEHGARSVRRSATAVSDGAIRGRGGWTATVGVQVDLDLPLPIPRDDGVAGMVFRDLNGNLRHDEGEPGVQSVELQKGWVHVQTDGRGRFEITERSVAERRLRLEPSSLPAGVVLPPSVQLPRSGVVEIPVIEPARLELVLFRDENANGRRDEAEAAVDRARVELTSLEDRQRRYRQRPASSGAVTFGAVLPGPYRLSISVPSTTFRDAIRVQQTMTLRPGAERRLTIPLRSGRDSTP